jgi:hypothetical protein
LRFAQLRQIFGVAAREPARRDDQAHILKGLMGAHPVSATAHEAGAENAFRRANVNIWMICASVLLFRAKELFGRANPNY